MEKKFKFYVIHVLNNVSWRCERYKNIHCQHASP